MENRGRGLVLPRISLAGGLLRSSFASENVGGTWSESEFYCLDCGRIKKCGPNSGITHQLPHMQILPPLSARFFWRCKKLCAFLSLADVEVSVG